MEISTNFSVARMAVSYYPCPSPQNLVAALDSGPRPPSAGDSIRRQWPPPRPPKPSRSSPPPLSGPPFAASPQHGGSQPRRSTPNTAFPWSRPLLASAEPAGFRRPRPFSHPARPLRTPRRPRQKVQPYYA